MDKVAQYQNIIIQYLEEYAAVPYGNPTEIKKIVISDREHNHFQLVSTGWDKGTFSFDVLFHFDIQEEKVWILQNWTEEEVAEELVELGVPKEDIVLGFIPESARPYSGYAVG